MDFIKRYPYTAYFTFLLVWVGSITTVIWHLDKFNGVSILVLFVATITMYPIANGIVRLAVVGKDN